MNLDQLYQQGFRMPEPQNVNRLAINSLRLALKSFFSTYSSIRYYAIPVFKDDREYEHIYRHQDYVEMYSETILHFQHFFELIIKDILRAKSDVLSLKVENQEVFIKLVMGETLTPEILEKQNTVEFNVALSRVVKLIEMDLGSPYKFLIESEVVETLKKLTNLRNKIWHRGSYVLRYYALDILISKYVLPIVNKIMTVEPFNSFNSSWKGSKNSLDVDPIIEIINEAQNVLPDLSKIAFFKELGRASYNKDSNIPGFGIFKDEVIARANSIVKYEMDNHHSSAVEVHDCPNCGLKTLVGYQDTEIEVNNEGEPIAGWEFIYQVKCHYCSFELRNLGMKNLSEYGMNNQPNYWSFKEL